MAKALSREVCWLCTSAKISNEGRGNFLLLIMGKNSTNLILYFDPSLSTENQLPSASSAQELLAFTEQVGRIDLSTFSELAAFDMLPCCSKNLTRHCEPIVKEKEWKKKREEGRKHEEQRKGEEGKKEGATLNSTSTWCHQKVIVPINMYIFMHGIWLVMEKEKKKIKKSSFFFHSCNTCIALTLFLQWMSYLPWCGSLDTR